MPTGSGHNTNPHDVVWFCHLCRWSGIIPAGQQHRCLKPDLDLQRRATAEHDVYVRCVDGGWDGYQAACDDCDWRGMVHTDKAQAQEDLGRHPEPVPPDLFQEALDINRRGGEIVIPDESPYGGGEIDPGPLFPFERWAKLFRGPVAEPLGGTGDGPEHPAPQTSGRSGSTTPSEKAELLAAHLGDLHPCETPEGWQEFEVTLSFYVTSDDPEVIERERQRIWDALPDAAITIADGSGLDDLLDRCAEGL